MCVIIDACVCHMCFKGQPNADAKPVIDWLLSGEGRLVYGGKLLDELRVLESARRLLGELKRAGRARHITSDAIEKLERTLKLDNLCKSNDLHVIALAKASGARTLFTKDQKLQEDFKNPALIKDPRGVVYQNKGHVKLLKHTKSCGFSKKNK